jgi:hypothetical protein
MNTVLADDIQKEKIRVQLNLFVSSILLRGLQGLPVLNEQLFKGGR